MEISISRKKISFKILALVCIAFFSTIAIANALSGAPIEQANDSALFQVRTANAIGANPQGGDIKVSYLDENSNLKDIGIPVAGSGELANTKVATCMGNTCEGTTCESTCWGQTCEGTCDTTCAGQSTCSPTCVSTCSGNTCQHTCGSTCGTSCGGTCGTTCGSSCGGTCGTTCDMSCLPSCSSTCGHSCPAEDCLDQLSYDFSPDCNIDEWP